MRNISFPGLIYFVLFVFIPLAFIPSSGRCAFLPSPACSSPPAPGALRELPQEICLPAGAFSLILREERLRYLSEEERTALARTGGSLLAGGQRSSPLETNEVVAIVLTLIMIGTVVAFVEQSRD